MKTRFRKGHKRISPVVIAGHYRITKSALVDCGTGDVTKYNLAAEFDVLSDEKSKELNARNDYTKDW